MSDTRLPSISNGSVRSTTFGGSPVDLTATINYFSSDPKFATEKPYTTSFPVDEIDGAAVSNHAFEGTKVDIIDIRGRSVPSLSVEGFTFAHAPTRMSFEDYEDRSTVQSKYFGELRDHLHRLFPEYSALSFFDYEIRRRSHLYPKAIGASVDHAQPLAQAHLDYSVFGASHRLQEQLVGSEAELLKRPCDVLNVWRPLYGPNHDWPLALCDFQSIDPSKEVLLNDIVYENSIGEDEFLQYAPGHRWYYLSAHDTDTMIVWRNTDLPGGHLPKAFHSAFDNPLCPPDARARSSIEVRLAAFR